MEDDDAIDLSEEHQQLGESNYGDEQPLANLVVVGNTEPKFDDTHASEGAPEARNTSEEFMYTEKCHKSEPQLHAVDWHVEEEHDVLIGRNVGDRAKWYTGYWSGNRDTPLFSASFAVNMFEDDEFHTSS